MPAETNAILEPKKVLETERRTRRLLKSGATRFSKRSLENLVVIGSGPVSHKFCEQLVQLGGTERFNVTVFGEERTAAYNRVLLTQSFFDRADRLLMAPQDWYQENGIQLHTGNAVLGIDRVNRTVRTRLGVSAPYERLVLATGSRPFMPEMEGAKLPGVFVYRTIEDIQSIKSYAPYCRRAAVLGGGLLGLEAADAVKKLGLKVWVVERGSSLMARQLDPEASNLLQEHVRSIGINICTAMEVERIEPIGTDRLLHFKSGEKLRVQMVIVAVGVRPRTELAEAAGLELHPRGGVVVNDHLATSDPRIFAIGECASHRGKFYGLAAPGYQMAVALSSSFCGRARQFKGADQSTALKLPGISIATLGDYQAGTNHLVAQSDGTYRRIALEKNRLVGVVSVGEWPEQRRWQELVERRSQVWRWQRARFVRTGSIWKARGELPVAEWPAEALICNCVGVRRGTLSAACRSGCLTADQLARKTGASTVCGSCRPLLEELTGAMPSAVRVPGTRFLLAGAILALVLALVVICLPGAGPIDSVRETNFLSELTHNHLARQVSGFTLVGISIASMMLSIRKRIKTFRWGDVGIWKAVHAILGVFTLVALISHTGFRLGHNLNFVLMCNFLGIAVVGGLTGGITALERRLPAQAARRLRAVWTGAHVALVWPLPVLILFHVLGSFRF